MASSDEFWQQLQKLSLCLRCQSVFCGVDQSGMVRKRSSSPSSLFVLLTIAAWMAQQTYEELGREVNHKIRCQGYEPRGSSPYCLCCLNSLDESQLERLADTIAQQCKEKETHSIRLEISLPPVLDAFRVLTRGLVCLDINSGLNFPTFEAIMAKVLVSMLRRRAVVPSTHSKWIVSSEALMLHSPKSDFASLHLYIIGSCWNDGRGVVSPFLRCLSRLHTPRHTHSSFPLCSQVTISADLPKQAQLLQAIDPSFKPKRLKRKAWEVDQLPLDLDSEPLTRASIDTHLKLWKSLRKGDLLAIMARTKHLYEQAASDQVALLKPRLKIHYTPIYLYGRYCKYARDVSQSPWALAADSGGGGEGDDPDDLRSGPSQKGRGSVEDIIGQAVRDVLGAEQVKLHGCGREDIDVRCLGKPLFSPFIHCFVLTLSVCVCAVGNGRPFALEILQSQQAPSPERIQNIFRNINTRQGGNKAGDVSLTQLQESNVTLWETMQVEAEEKDKRYCCLVWTSRPVTAAELRTLEEQSNRSVDPTQRPCVQVGKKRKTVSFGDCDRH